jgi:hypothetical protein
MFRISLPCLVLLSICMFPGYSLAKKEIPGVHAASLDLASPVAVLPFTWNEAVKPKVRENLADLPRLAREIFAESFATLPYEDMDEAVVLKKIRDAGFLEENRWQAMKSSDLGSLIGAGTLVEGEITKASLGKSGLWNRTVFGIRISFVDGKSEMLHWQGTAESKRYGGLLLHTGLATEFLSELSSNEAQRRRTLENTVRDAMRKILLTLPPTENLVILTPVIETGQVKIEPGPPKEITVEIRGTPDCIATFDIGSFRRYIPLWEVESGMYRGSYIAQPNDSAASQEVRVRLESRLGVAAVRRVEQEAVTLP